MEIDHSIKRIQYPGQEDRKLNMKGIVKAPKSGIAVGSNKGHIVTPRAYPLKKTPQVSL